MPDLDTLFSRLSAAAGDVSTARNAGDGSVPLHAIDALLDASQDLLSHADQVTAEEDNLATITPGSVVGPPPCTACGHIGDDLEVMGDGEILCADQDRCHERLKARQGLGLATPAPVHPEFPPRAGDVWLDIVGTVRTLWTTRLDEDGRPEWYQGLGPGRVPADDVLRNRGGLNLLYRDDSDDPIIYLATLKLAPGSQRRYGEPHDGYTHLVRGARRGCPGPTLCCIDRTQRELGYEIGSGYTARGRLYLPCPGCVNEAKRLYPGLPVVGFLQYAQPMAAMLNVQAHWHSTTAIAAAAASDK